MKYCTVGKLQPGELIRHLRSVNGEPQAEWGMIADEHSHPEFNLRTIAWIEPPSDGRGSLGLVEVPENLAVFATGYKVRVVADLNSSEIIDGPPDSANDRLVVSGKSAGFVTALESSQPHLNGSKQFVTLGGKLLSLGDALPAAGDTLRDRHLAVFKWSLSYFGADNSGELDTFTFWGEQ